MLIGIAGKKGSGKDTLAELFIANGFSKYAFADHLRTAASVIFDQPLKLFSDPKLKDQPFKRRTWFGKYKTQSIKMDMKTRMAFIKYFRTEYSNDVLMNHLDIFHGIEFERPRDILQFIGTTVCRDLIDPDFHVNIVFKKMDLDNYEHVVISDARFLNERKRIEERGGINILITRPEEKTDDDHLSENDLGYENEYKYIVRNDKDIQHLNNQVLSILEDFSIKNLQ